MERIVFEIEKPQKEELQKKCKEAGFRQVATVLRALVNGYIDGNINVRTAAEMGVRK